MQQSNSQDCRSSPLDGELLDWNTIDALYSAIQELAGRPSGLADFQRFRAKVMERLASAAHLKAPINNLETLAAKQALCDYCFEELAQCTLRYDPRLCALMSFLYKVNTSLMDSFRTLVLCTAKDKAMPTSGEDGQAFASQATKHPKKTDSRTSRSAEGTNKVDDLQAKNEDLCKQISSLELQMKELQAQLAEAQSQLQHLHPLLEALNQQTSQPHHHAAAGSVDFSTQRQLMNAAMVNGLLHPVSSETPDLQVISLDMLKEIIEDVYSSKVVLDAACLQSGLPRKTMAQHMCTYFEQPFKSKGAANNWCKSIIAGCLHYAEEDNDVAVFAKILTNEIDEEFRLVQKQLKETVRELLHLYLRKKYSSKEEGHLQGILQKKMAGVLQEDEWVNIISYMFNAEDFATTMSMVYKVLPISPTQGTSPSVKTGVQTGPSIPYQTFLKVLLDFQLEAHDKFLARFVSSFRRFDIDHDGVLREEEFRDLLQTIGCHKPRYDMDQLLRKMDPHHTGTVTFSQCVACLPAELVAMTT